MQRGPFVKDLVLLGGGHSHVEVLRSFGMRPMPGVRLTLITRDMMTPYSGMLPGYISGFYSYEDCHIDLARMAAFAQARLIHAEACKIDIKSRRIFLRQDTPRPGSSLEAPTAPLPADLDRPAIPYDVLSVGIGITPGKEQVPGASEHTTGVKPIDKFVHKLEAVLERYRTLVSFSMLSSQSTPLASMQVVVVGGGAGGVEVALSLQHRLEEERKKLGRPESCRAKITLVCRGSMLERNTSYVRSAFLRICKQRGVHVLEGGAGVAEVQKGRLRLAPATTPAQPNLNTQASPAGPSSSTQAKGGEGDGEWIVFDECLWCTQAAAAGWLKETGLPLDPMGFLAVNDCLQSDGGPPEVFAAGDVASCTPYPRPKAGVFAVRQGPPLAANLRRYLGAEPLVPFVPQSTFLSLITAGDRYCVGTKGWVSLEGNWLWNWKDNIDRTFMRKYGEDLPDMDKMMAAAGAMAPIRASAGSGTVPASSWLGGLGLLPRSSSSISSRASGAGLVADVDKLRGGLQAEAAALFAESKMRCGGCGSKVGASVLSQVIQKLPAQPEELIKASGVLVGMDSPDDAAVIRPPPPGHVLIQTVDYFKSLMGSCEDPYVFGKVAANHALSDCFAMGGKPSTAMAVATVPFASERLMENDLSQMMSGAMQALNEAGCVLVGGHTSEGEALGLGFSITGFAEESKVMKKGGLLPGDVLILTKPLGTGIIMKALMKGQAVGTWLPAALQHCTASNAAAAEVLSSFGSRGCTDVTGFGLIGHLVEMTKSSKVHVELDLDTVPFLQGATELILSGGQLSSIHAQNARAASAISNLDALKSDERWPLLVDPQTGGGLLAGVPAAQADDCLQALVDAGCSVAAVIGTVTEVSMTTASPVKVKGWGLP